MYNPQQSTPSNRRWICHKTVFPQPVKPIQDCTLFRWTKPQFPPAKAGGFHEFRQRELECDSRPVILAMGFGLGCA